MAAPGSTATLSRRLRLLLWIIVPLPPVLLLVTSTHQYESELRVESERRLSARAKDSGLAVYGRLVDLVAELRWAARQPGVGRRLEEYPGPWRDHYHRLLMLGEGEHPEGTDLAAEAAGTRWSERLRAGESVLVEAPVGDGKAALWIAVPAGDGSDGKLWAEIRVDWLWKTAVLPSEGGVSWLLLGAGGRSLLASSPDPDPGFVTRVRSRAEEGVGGFDWDDGGGIRWRAVFVTIPLGFGFGHPGLVAAVGEIDQLGPEAALLRRTSWLVAIGALLVAALVSVRRLRGDLGPLSALLLQADRMAGGELSARVSVSGAADLERLAGGFNRMGEMLQRSFQLLEAANAVAAAALAPAPTVEELASIFVEKVRPIAPAPSEPVVILFDRELRPSVVRAHGDGPVRVEPWRAPLPSGLAAILESTGWIRTEEPILEAPAGPRGGASAWRAIRRGGRVFGAVGLLGSESGGPDADFVRALEGPSSQLDLAISRVHLIEERARAEAALRAAERRLSEVIASSPAVLYALAVDGAEVRGISWMSENVLDLLGYSVEETRRVEWWFEKVHPDDREAALAEFRAQLLAHGRAATEYRVLHRDGTYRWMRNEGRLVRNATGAPLEVIGAFSEITERKQLEAQVRQAQRMEALGRLAGGVAHDFNNLLTIISGYGEKVLSALAPADPRRDEIMQILEAGNRAAGLTRQLLAFSRQSILEPRVLDLNEVVRENEKLLRRVIGEDIELSTDLEPGLRRVKVDAGQIGQVLMNVAINSRDAMPSGGKLVIRSENVQVDAELVATRPEVKPGSFVALSVADTGSGMTPEVQARIFEPFFTTKGPGIGTGLGLATVYGIVQQSGGFIDVASEPGRGTTFTLHFPASEEVAAPRKRSLDLRPTARGSETILLVEDEDLVRSMLREVLEEIGYSVLEASRGTEALRLAGKHAGPIHLLITDVVMPEMGGGQLVDNLIRARPELRVLYISGYTDDAVVRQGVLQSDVAFLQKPFTMAALTTRVRQLLDGGTDRAG